MEMMDIRTAIRWFNESSDLMKVIGKSLASQPKGETDFLKRELIAAHRALIETALNASLVAAILINEQVTLELPLLMGHAEDYSALAKAQAHYREESNKACSVLESTAPLNPTARATPHALEPRTDTPDDANLSAPTGRKPPNGSVHKPRQPRPVLAPEPSAALRDQLIAEIQCLTDGEEIALWAHRRLPAKNTLTADDARAVETACRIVLGALELDADKLQQPPADAASCSPVSAREGGVLSKAAGHSVEDRVTPLRKETRRRNKPH